MEILDVYNRNHELTGRTTVRGAMDLTEQERVLAVHIAILNSRGELLIQQRQTTKKRYPGCWDVSAGGLAQQGEGSMKGILRETWEELGLRLSLPELTFLLTAEFDYMLDDFFLVRRDIDLNTLRLQKEEVLAVRWATEEEILQMRRDGVFVDYEERIIRAIFAVDKEQGL